MSGQAARTTPAEILLEQLKAAKVNGFPFFAYMGIRQTSTTEDMVTLKMPKNPNGIHYVYVRYDRGTDTYGIMFYKGFVAKSSINDIYVGQLAEAIARGVGVL